MADELTGIDPFNYTVDQTIQILSPHLSPEHVQSLRFNEVTGRVLLKTASYDTLKSELDIIPLGRRERIMDVVGSLRRESAAYQEYQLHLAQQTPLPLDEDEDLTEIKPLCLPPTTTDKRKRKRQEPLPLPPRFDEPPSPRFATPSLHPLQLWVDNSPLFIRFPRGDEPLAAYVDADHQLCNVEMLRGETAADSEISVPAAIDPVVTDQQSDEIEGPPLLHQEDHAGSKRVTPIQVTPLPRDDEEPVVLEGITGLPSPMSDVGDNLDAGSKRIASADDLGVEYMDISESEPENTSPRLPEEPSGPKRIAPTTIAPTRNLDDEMDISDPEPQPIPPSKKGKGASAKRYYLAPKARKIESLFYDVPPGDDISLDYDGNDQFQVVAAATKFPGERRYVGRRICRLLKDNSQILEDFSMGYATGSATGQLVRTVHQGRLRVAIKHYDNPERYLRKYEHQTFTVFDVEHSGVRAHRESTKSLHLPWPSLTKPSTSSASDIQIVRHADEPQVPWPIEIDSNDNSIHDYDYLLKWQNIDGADEVLPVFGESDDEGEYDEQTWREYQAEFGPKEKVPTKSRRRVYLTKEEVGEAVEEGIRDVVQRWRVKILPKKEAKDAYRLWRKAKKHRNRNQNIKEARAGIKALNERLDKMKTEFLKSEMNWSSRDMVRKQVKGSTEQTVYDREDLEWIIDLMRRKEPIKPPPKKKAGASTKEGNERSAGRADSDDEESVGSSSDDDQFSESDTGMGGFIISDLGKLDDDENESDSDSDSEDEEEEDDVMRPAKRQRPNPEVVDDSDGDSDGDDIGSLSSPRALPQISQQIKAENSPVGERNYIDLTLDESPPRRKAKPPVIELESETDRATSPKQSKGKEKAQDHQSESRELEQRRKSSGGKLATPVPEVSIRDQRYEVLRSVVHEIHEKGESIKYQAVCCRYRDLDEHTAWFSTIVEGLKCLHKLNPQNLYELEITRNTCRLYIAWLFRRRNATGYDKVTKDELSRLNDFRRFMAFIEDLMHIYNGGELRSESRPPKKVRGGEIPKSGVKKQSKVRSKPEREDYEFDDLDNSQFASSSQHRKRKRQQVIEDETAKSRRNKHQSAHKNIIRRMQDHERKARKKGEVVEDGKMILNKGHYAKHKDILPHPEYIQEKLKQHQIEGIRFLWTQLVLVGENGGGVGENRGALLAHTMGLGKTLQVITFLYTLAEAGASEDKAVYEQIPEHLRKSKTLILCPPGLVDNWWDEFHNWLPFDENTGELSEKYIGKIYRADGQISIGERMRAINRWNVSGGILLLGYHMFRSFIFNQVTRGQQQLREAEHAAVKKILLEGPNVIVADEAHNLKNPGAMITQAAKGFKSLSRIAMTGSPLSNNLNEYWSMIEWIDPGYLGPAKEFKDKYVDPIADGLYADSSYEEKRVSLKMLKVLKHDISYKINRADIDVIRDDMPQKTEFLVTIPLTALQTEMYRRFIEDRQTANIVANIRALKLTSFFDVTGLLSLICSHPSIFVRRIEKRERDREGILRRGAASGAVNGERTPELDEDEDVTEDGTTSAAPNALLDTDTIEQKYSWAQPLLDKHEGDKIEHSFKMLAFRDILKCSNEVGDSTLVFSHSIPTLDILENHVKAMGLKYLRLDGKTPMGDRQKSAKKFNTGDCAVFLVSTEAGGLGLNLYGANRVIIFDFKWSPTWESQAVGRAYRLGQKKHVFVYRFRSGGTYEDKMWNTAQFKSQLQSRVVDTKAPIREAHKKIQQYLAPPKEIPREDISAFEGKDMVLDRVIAHSREAGGYICSIEHTETFQPDADDALNEDEQKEVDELLKQAQASRELAEKEAKALQKVRRSSFSSSAPAPVTSTTVSSLSNNNGVPLSTAPTPGRISEAPSTVATSSPSAAPSPVTNPKIKDAEMRPPPYPLPPKAVPSSQPTARPSAKPSSSAPAPAPWSFQQARETKQLLDRLNQAAQQRPSLPIASSRLTQSEIGRLPENNDSRRLSDNLLTVQRSSGSESGRRSSSDIPQGSSTLEEIIRSTLPRVFKGRKSNGGSNGA